MSQKQEESELSRRIKNALNARGHWIVKNHGSAFSKRGLSDLSGGAKRNVPAWLETKLLEKERSGLSSDQSAFLKECVRRCPLAVVSVVSSVADAIWAMEGEGLYAHVDGEFVSMVKIDQLSESERAAVFLALERRK